MLVNEVDLPVIAADDCTKLGFFWWTIRRLKIKKKIGSTSGFADRSNNSGVRESRTPSVYLHAIGWLNGSSSRPEGRR